MRGRNTYKPILRASVAVLVVGCGSGVSEDRRTGDDPTGGAQVADVIYTGTFVTLDPDAPEVEALAVLDGRTLFAGASEEAEAWAGPDTRHVEIPGVAVPGFADAHVHASSLGALLDEGLNLRGLDKNTLVGLVAEKAADTPAGSWIFGGGWDQGFFASGEFPTAADLDAATSEHPVVLTRIDGHASWVNSRVLELAGIGADTPDPEGGRIERYPDGSPAGVLVDNAQALVTPLIPRDVSAEDRERRLRLAVDQYAQWGLTSIHDAGVGLETIEIYERLLAQGELPVRVYAMAQGPRAVEHYLEAGPRTGADVDRLSVRSFKVILDGALGSRGALFDEPYTDAPDEMGLPQIAEADFEALMTSSIERGFQVNAHAIGDRAVRWALDAFERAGVTEAERFRVEHASTIAPPDLPRFAALGVIASMQPVFVGEYSRWAEDRVGPDRVRWVMPVGELARTGAVIASGTDFTASDTGDPIFTLDALVNRRGADGSPAAGWFYEQRVDVETALQSMSWGPAVAAFQEEDIGRLTAGRYADFTVLSADPRNIPAPAIRDLVVTMTVLDGDVTYVRGDVPD